MTKSLEDVQNLIIDDLDKHDLTSDSATALLKNLSILATAQATLRTDPIPEPEPTGFRGFLHRNSGDLIKVGGTISAIALIGFVETKFSTIIRPKASKFI